MFNQVFISSFINSFSIKSPAGCKIEITQPNYLIFGLVVLGVIVIALSIWLTIKFKMGKGKKDDSTNYVSFINILGKN